MPRTGKPISVSAFKGINNVVRDHELGPDEYRAITNMDVTDRNKLVRRKGVTEVDTGDFHSLGGSSSAAFVVKDGALYSIDSDDALTLVRSNMAATRISYSELNGEICYTNGTQSGRIENETSSAWGLATPTNAPTATAGTGGLPAGVYQLVLTYSKSSGQESGASLSTKLVLTAQGGLALSAMPTTTAADLTNIYLTKTNGEVFFLIASVASSTTTYTVSGANYGRELQTQFLDPIPSGQFVTHHKGRMYVADDSTVWYEEAFTSGLTRFSSNFFSFPETVTMLEAVDGGVFVAADKLYFLKGTDPAQMSQMDYPYDAISGTAVRVPGAKFQEGEIADEVVIWISSKGILAGLPNGEIQNLTENQVSYPASNIGASLFRQEDGAAKFITALKEPTADGESFSISDRVTAAVYRRGILLT